MDTQERRRLRIVLSLGCCGGLYGVWLACTGLGIPCPFHLLTGLLCPGCGISRALLALCGLHGVLALRCNAAAVLLLPVLCWLLLCMACGYVRRGCVRLSARQDRAAIAAGIVLVLFGAARNLPMLWFLRPPV